MASKKKVPSFEIPATVTRAGQAGWVYRTDAPHGKTARKRTAGASAKAAQTAVTVVQPVLPPAPVAPPAPAAPEPVPNVAARLVGLGLQVAAVPFMVPLYLTAAVSRRLGTTGAQ